MSRSRDLPTQPRRRKVPYTRGGTVTIRRIDGSTDTQPAYTPLELHNVVGRRPPRSGKHLKITLKHAAPCCICHAELRVGERAWWWPALRRVSCVRHEPRTPADQPT